ncbi:hypothetical protein CSW64_14140 [Caulobacter mirabilis]|uniref:Cysteine dioxygenase n=1 Tax=Caulobacter mirabilis TaxID=69666 RepID=A0A2D2AZM9_9CAUL|nr:hypothetical protein CSW64_14140 [Caulobacter mirabilis]
MIRQAWPRPEVLFSDAPPAGASEAGAGGVSPAEHYTGYVFPVSGQGTISFTFKADRPFRIVVNSQPKPSYGSREVVVLEVTDRRAAFLRANTDLPRDVLDETTEAKALLNPGAEQLAYWLSLDTNNRVLKYGKGEMLNRLVLFTYRFPPKPEPPLADPFAYLAGLKCIALSGVETASVADHALSSLPVTLDPPPQIIATDQITLEDIAENLFSVAADLPQACQALYANVAGPSVTLRPKDFPEFPEAINYSINTPGGLCYRKLDEKPKQFGYLRITMDPNLGDSPGSPYVLEIWPAQHGSPIHDHGDACAVIKVLEGTIRVKWFPGLSPDIEVPFGQVDLTEGDVTFLTPRAYQIHQLFNPDDRKRMTATIQCYRYPADDTVHYEYFDYVEDGVIKQFTPDSDWEYLEFKALIRKEWDARPR